MKKVVLLIISILLFSITHTKAQEIYCKASSDEFQGVKGATFWMVKTGVQEVDDTLYGALKKYFKIGKVKRLSKEKLDDHLGDPSQYFICLADVRHNNIDLMEKMPSYLASYQLVLISGKYKKLKKYCWADMIAVSPLPLRGKNTFLCNFCFAAKTLSQLLKIDFEKQIDETWNNITIQIAAEINQNASKLKDKTLLVQEDFIFDGLGILTHKNLATYKYKYKTVSEDELETLIAEGSDEYCVLSTSMYHIGCFEIYDVATKKLFCMLAPRKENGMLKLSKDCFDELDECIKTGKTYWFKSGFLQ